MEERRWEPLVGGALAARACRVAHEIAAEVDELLPSDEVGLKGDASAALLLDRCGLPSAVSRLESALTVITRRPAPLSLFGGVTGTSWVLRHLAEGADVDRAAERLDAAILRHLDVPVWEERHDLLSGLAGVGVLVAGRTDPRGMEIADRVLAHLESTATHSDAGVTWWTPARFLPERVRARFPDGLIDLGVAHGVPGIIGMLAAFVEHGVEPLRSGLLLEAAARWLLDAVPAREPRFGASWPIDFHDVKRVGWCYGDAGVGAVLLRAGCALSLPDLQATALGILAQSAAPLAERPPRDAGFCHGAAGVAHIYNVAFQRTGDARMHAEAVRWIEEVLRWQTPGTGIGGYTSLNGVTGAWEDNARLLSGAVGVALVLLAATEDDEPEWQRLFVV